MQLILLRANFSAALKPGKTAKASGSLTGDAEAEHVVELFHELLEQSALPSARRAGEHHRLGTSHG